MTDFMQSASYYVIPLVIVVLCAVFIKNGELYSSFVRGAKEGVKTIFNILPTMTLLVVALSMFNESGAAGFLSELLSPYSSAIELPSGIIPLVITRPLSGSAATAAFASVLDTFGADSLEAFTAAVIMGSGDTLIYVISVYYSATSVHKTKYVFPLAAFVAVLAVFISCILAGIFY